MIELLRRDRGGRYREVAQEVDSLAAKTAWLVRYNVVVNYAFLGSLATCGANGRDTS